MADPTPEERAPAQPPVPSQPENERQVQPVQSGSIVQPPSPETDLALPPQEAVEPAGSEAHGQGQVAPGLHQSPEEIAREVLEAAVAAGIMDIAEMRVPPGNQAPSLNQDQDQVGDDHGIIVLGDGERAAFEIRVAQNVDRIMSQLEHDRNAMLAVNREYPLNMRGFHRWMQLIRDPQGNEGQLERMNQHILSIGWFVWTCIIVGFALFGWFGLPLLVRLGIKLFWMGYNLTWFLHAWLENGADQIENFGRPYGLTWSSILAWMITWPLIRIAANLTIGALVAGCFGIRNIVRAMVDCMCNPLLRLMDKIRRWKPLVVLPDQVDGQNFNAECPICLENVAVENDLRLPCGHILHHSCGKMWFERSRACPFCRKVAVE